MDIHLVPGVKARDVAEAHRKDLLHQQEHGCHCMTYWIDEVRENIFCLIEAPDQSAVETMHARAHGLVPNRIIEVNSQLVEAFLGRIYDPTDATVESDGLKVFKDSSLRFLLRLQTQDPILLLHQHGNSLVEEWFEKYYALVREHINGHQGREAEHEGTGLIASFASASQAASCALCIQEGLRAHPAMNQALGVRMSIDGGDPVQESNRLFGETLSFAECLCWAGGGHSLTLSHAAGARVAKDFPPSKAKALGAFTPTQESLLKIWYSTLQAHWNQSEYDVEDYAREAAMSPSQFFRKTISLLGHSPNHVIKSFRLERAKALLRHQTNNIAQVTFECGFTSPSYFTKCFKKAYHLLPMEYLDLLQHARIPA